MKRYLTIAAFLLLVALTATSCKTRHNCPAYSSVETVESQNSEIEPV